MVSLRNFAACAALSLVSLPLASQSASSCAKDLDALLSTLSADYPGYVLFEKRWPKKLEAAIERARTAVRGLEGAACDKAIRDFLGVFQDGHLLLHSKHSPAVDMPPPLFAKDRAPSARTLGEDAFLVRAPSFNVSYKRALDSLLAKHEAEIRDRPYLVVDLRGNTGGGDSTWAKLLAPVYDRPVTRWPVVWRVSEGNVRAIEQQADGLERAKRAPATCAGLRNLAKAMRDERAKREEPLAPLGPQIGRTVTLPEVWTLPRRVAILIDGSCGSSCENFLLAARQSGKALLIGERTYGAVDFQNARVAPLPSGRQLQFGMTMSRRLEKESELSRGIPPAYKLSEEVLRDAEGAVRAALQHLRRPPSTRKG